MRRFVIIGCLLLSACFACAKTVTYVFNNYQSLTVTGEPPIGSEATIYNDTRSGTRVGAGHTATLTLTGFDGATISAIYLAMRSNKSSGAGSMQLYVGNELVASIPESSFASNNWFGSYVDSIVSIPVPLTSAFTVPMNTQVVLTVSASVNSLHFAGCMIDYSIEDPEPRTVSFITSTEEIIRPVIESAAGEGVILPFADDADSVWHFLGWADKHYARTTSRPSFHEPGTRFYPRSDCQLYALYTDKRVPEPIVQDTSMQSGVYAIASALQPCMMMGAVELQVIGSAQCSVRERADSMYMLSLTTLPPEVCYYIDFSSSGATIRHTETGEYVGYNSTATTHYLRSSADRWSVFRGKHGTVQFYHDMKADSMAYCLCASLSQGQYWFGDRTLKLYPESQYLVLFPAPSAEHVDVHYTTHPFSEDAIITMSSEDIRIVGQNILNPSRLLLRLFSLNGNCLLTTHEDISLASLSSGIYILYSPISVQKIVVL